MISGIPLPGAPAGSFQEGMKNANELSKQVMENRIKNVQSQFAPITVPAEAASKLAYANLMGPQFLAKLMGNPDIVANLGQGQRENALQTVYGAGSGQTIANPFLNRVMQGVSGQQSNPLLSLVNKVISGAGNVFGFNPQQQQPQQSQQTVSNSPIMQSPVLSQQDRSAIPNLQPGQSYTIQGNQGTQMPVPANAPAPLPLKGENDYFERAGRSAGIKSEGEESGKIRSKYIDELGNKYEAALDRGYAYDGLVTLMNTPAFQEMRSKVPFFQQTQLRLLSKVGTPEQKKLIGNFITTGQELVRDTINSFQGQKMKGEISIARDMKISDDDTFDVMVGKLQSGMTFNEFIKTRSQMAASIMRENHVDRQTALQEADRKLDGNAIRQQVNDRLNPTTTIRNHKTGEVITVPVSEARSRYGVRI